ncbi:MAG TPA: protein kinase, partial [Pirellulales bacterium]|nr:protein kinase [Pirellulales bacterium]
GELSAAAPPDELTGSGQVLGTVDYMAPEQALNTRHADHRSDIYSLGCTLYYLLTGKPPYAGETPMERLLAHREHPIPSLTSECPEAPPALVAIFEKMMAKAPDQRYQDVTAVLDDLAACDAALAASVAVCDETTESAGDEPAPQRADLALAAPLSAAPAALTPPTRVERPVRGLWEPLEHVRIWHWALGAATGGLLVLLAGIVFLTFFAR